MASFEEFSLDFKCSAQLRHGGQTSISENINEKAGGRLSHHWRSLSGLPVYCERETLLIHLRLAISLVGLDDGMWTRYSSCLSFSVPV